jgi:uncharacterized protein YjbI with pentapeptide repeats
LREVNFGFNDLVGANFAGQNLTNAVFVSANLTGAVFAVADARGADFDNLSGAITTNLIRSNGHIDGLDLDASGLLVVRDYDGDSRYEPARPPIPITIDEHLSMGPGGTLRMVFEADVWDSTISFAPGIPVMLGGALELTFAADVNLANQLGRTFDLFDWTGVNPTGAFVVSSPYAWNLSNLYTTGEATLIAVPEPAVIALAAVGMLGLALSRRRRVELGLDSRIAAPVHSQGRKPLDIERKKIKAPSGRQLASRFTELPPRWGSIAPCIAFQGLTPLGY